MTTSGFHIKVTFVPFSMPYQVEGLDYRASGVDRADRNIIDNLMRRLHP